MFSAAAWSSAGDVGVALALEIYFSFNVGAAMALCLVGTSKAEEAVVVFVLFL